MVANPTTLDSGVPAEGTAEQLRVAVISDATPERNGVGSYYSDLVAQLDGRIGRAELFCPDDDGQHWHRYMAPPLPGDSDSEDRGINARGDVVGTSYSEGLGFTAMVWRRHPKQRLGPRGERR